MAAQVKIKNIDDQAISLADLDKEAAELWDVEVHPRWYASPDRVYNWFEVIGFVIAMNGLRNWVDVVDHIIELCDGIDNAKPYLNLINLWNAKGYIPYGF